jgi:hypothetical protein
VTDTNTPADSPLTLDDVLASPIYGDLMTPNVQLGDTAFDFELTPTGVRLSDHTGKRPVALIFGSYT